MSKPFWVYILRCADGSYYTGHTDDLELRVAKHQSGEVEGYTATRRPIQLAYAQECVTREEALRVQLEASDTKDGDARDEIEGGDDARRLDVPRWQDCAVSLTCRRDDRQPGKAFVHVPRLTPQLERCTRDPSRDIDLALNGYRVSAWPSFAYGSCNASEPNRDSRPSSLRERGVDCCLGSFSPSRTSSPPDPDSPDRPGAVELAPHRGAGEQSSPGTGKLLRPLGLSGASAPGSGT